jgi:hypothetical protein
VEHLAQGCHLSLARIIVRIFIHQVSGTPVVVPPSVPGVSAV